MKRLLGIVLCFVVFGLPQVSAAQVLGVSMYDHLFQEILTECTQRAASVGQVSVFDECMAESMSTVGNSSDAYTGLEVTGGSADSFDGGDGPDYLTSGNGPQPFDGGDGPDYLNGTNEFDGGDGPDFFAPRGWVGKGN